MFRVKNAYFRKYSKMFKCEFDGSITFPLLTLECYCETPEQHCQALPFIGGEEDGEAGFRKTVCSRATFFCLKRRRQVDDGQHGRHDNWLSWRVGFSECCIVESDGK